MTRTGGKRQSTWRTAGGRLAAVALVMGAMSAAVFAPSTAGAATTQTASEISSVKNSKVGTILTAGNTVYVLKPSNTACDAACLKIWPPVLLPDGVTTATAGTGVDESKLGTVMAADGALQITYDGKPLYWFSKDKAAGQVKGNVTDKWGKWAAVVTKKSSSGSGGSGGSTPSNGGNAF